MTEQEWNNCTDPQAMLTLLMSGQCRMVDGEQVGDVFRRPSDRKLRLFACASARAHACGPKAPRLVTAYGKDWQRDCLAAIRAAEDAADGLAPLPEFRAQPGSAWTVWSPDAAEAARVEAGGGRDAKLQAAILRDLIGNPWRPVELPHCCIRCGCTDYGGDMTGRKYITPTVLALATAAYTEQPGRKCEACKGEGRHEWWDRESAQTTWARCGTCCGKGIVEDGALDPDRLAVLSDALEEAGCPPLGCVHCVDGIWGEYDDDARTPIACATPSCALLGHLRSPGPHYRGMWSLDLILRKE